MQNPQDVQLATQALLNALPREFRDCARKPVALILGTGLSGMARGFAGGRWPRIPFSELPGFPLASVPSHEGAFVAALLNGLPILIQQGRRHLYEGSSPAEICMGVRVLAGAGAEILVITNAAGALNPEFSAGGLMCMSDMINHTGLSPLSGANHDGWGERFPDMSQPFDPRLRRLAMACALGLGIRLEQGVYIGVHGPEMETPAETRMYRQWGADAIGMSTVLEVIAARHMGMRVLGISCLANKNLPDCPEPAPLEEIIRVAEAAGQDLERLLLDFFQALAAKQIFQDASCSP